MRQQQDGALPHGPATEVCDRLAGLLEVIRPDQVEQALLDTGRRNPRQCCLTHEVTLWVVLAMGILTDLPLRQVFKACRRFRLGEVTPGRSSLCEARKRLGVAPLQHLFTQVVRPLATSETPGAFAYGLRLVAASRQYIVEQRESASTDSTSLSPTTTATASDRGLGVG
jgi:hypothetical protein